MKRQSVEWLRRDLWGCSSRRPIGGERGDREEERLHAAGKCERVAGKPIRSEDGLL